MSSDLLSQLQKLSGAIDRHKSGTTPAAPISQSQRPHKYINPQYQSKQIPYKSRTTFVNKPWTPAESSTVPANKEVVIGGVEFESSKNKLTRKGAPAIAKTMLQPPIRTPTLAPSWSNRKPYAGNASESRRGGYKPRGGRRKNMTLNNVERTKKEVARARKAAKQCPFFSKTGLCGRGKKCFYQHDPKKVAICPRFMKHDCPHDGEHCLLSHEPTPERVTLCVHFANSGFCKNGGSCLFPHFNIGPKEGVCRDFAVLGYCEKGIDCEHQHLRECPTFAESGKCKNDKCRLPHVIRANANRTKSSPSVKKASASEDNKKPVRYGISFSTLAPETVTPSVEEVGADTVVVTEPVAGDYISLTFEESSEEDEEDNEDEESGGESEDEEDDPPDV